MNPKLLEHYKKELLHIREMGGEFAREYPKIAGRLGLETLECSDPYVERLLEGFAFLAARVKLKIDTSYSKLARHLLEMVYPDYLAPTPSMVIAQFNPSLQEGSLDQGFTIDRGTRLRSQVPPDTQTECDFRTAHSITMWPIEVSSMRYLNSKAALEVAGITVPNDVRSALAITLTASNEVSFSELAIDELSFHICGSDNAGVRLYEQLFRHTRGIEVVANGKAIKSIRHVPELVRQGFEDDEALLPVNSRTFQGYRLMQEYFAFPARFQFMKVNHLQSRLKKCECSEVELVFLFDQCDSDIVQNYSVDNIRLNCVPAINLFPKSTDRIHLSKQQHEYHVVPDRTRPLDYEIYSIEAVEGIGGSVSDTQQFYPYYSVNEQRRNAHRFFGINREPRELSSRQKRRGSRASYLGSEVFVSLVDSKEAPYRSDLRQLALKAHCTNRDLPLQMPVGRTSTDFNLDIGAPVASIKCIAGPTIPRASRAGGRDAWQLISNLSLNYLSIGSVDEQEGEQAAAMLRQTLELYIDERRDTDKRQLEGIVSVTSKPVVRQRRYRSHVEIAHGIEVDVKVDESAFEGTGAYLLGSVLERYFARYASVNSFSETVLSSVQRSEIERWPVQLGTRQSL
ncbi:MAG: type VI secretion system baseplate subunit TssF [Granulosicoccus sp.]